MGDTYFQSRKSGGWGWGWGWGDNTKEKIV